MDDSFDPFHTSFTCDVCSQDYVNNNFDHALIYVDGQPICDTCAINDMLPLFEEALENEQCYPPMWGSYELPFDDFERLFRCEDMRQAWFERVIEYETPTSQRVYCKHEMFNGNICNEFVGRKTKKRFGACDSISGCEKHMCLECRGLIYENYKWHQCGFFDLNRVYSLQEDAAER